MFRFPPFFTPYNYSYYNYYYNMNNHKKRETISKQNEIKNNSITNNENISNTINNENTSQENRNLFSNLFNFSPISIGPLYFNPSAISDNSIPVFEMFGIKLFLDDVIIICLLIFLYQEQVKDEMLYIILFLLLFS